MGITDFVNPNDIGEKTVSEVIKEMTGGRGADYCFECIGSAAVMAEAFNSSRTVSAHRPNLKLLPRRRRTSSTQLTD